jgi:hypothetical protein
MRKPYTVNETATHADTRSKKTVNDTPATTIVEECKRADTGVGPSIALGNQPENISIEDLVKTENKRSGHRPFNMARNRQISPTRLMQSANEEEEMAWAREEKVPIK